MLMRQQKQKCSSSYLIRYLRPCRHPPTRLMSEQILHILTIFKPCFTRVLYFYSLECASHYPRPQQHINFNVLEKSRFEKTVNCQTLLLSIKIKLPTVKETRRAVISSKQCGEVPPTITITIFTTVLVLISLIIHTRATMIIHTRVTITIVHYIQYIIHTRVAGEFIAKNENRRRLLCGHSLQIHGAAFGTIINYYQLSIVIRECIKKRFFLEISPKSCHYHQLSLLSIAIIMIL